MTLDVTNGITLEPATKPPSKQCASKNTGPKGGRLRDSTTGRETKPPRKVDCEISVGEENETFLTKDVKPLPSHQVAYQRECWPSRWVYCEILPWLERGNKAFLTRILHRYSATLAPKGSGL